MSDTHVVTNQVPPLENHNPASSAVLIEALIREGGQWGLEEVNEVGALAGTREAQRWGELADRNRPILHTHDRYGHRIDEVEYDPAYHELMRTMRERILNDTFLPFYKETREKLAASCEEFPVKPPKVKTKAGPALALGDFEIVTGAFSSTTRSSLSGNP